MSSVSSIDTDRHATADASAARRPDADPAVKRPLVFGEVLYDCFPDGTSVLGGAPFNVAWNLRGFDFDPLLVSAVGDDELGERVLGTMGEHGMDTSAVPVLNDHPTGRVDVLQPRGERGEVEYRFQDDAAWDHIEADTSGDDRFVLLYHGTLAARREGSRRTLRRLRARAGRPIFVDLNLRPPHVDPEMLPTLLHDATWLKLNREELTTVSDRFDGTPGSLEARARAVARRLRVANVLVTDGDGGAWWVAEGEIGSLFAPAPPARPLVDTVGAGDAFTAVVAAGLLSGWSRRNILDRAVRFAARVCGLRGATTPDRDFYESETRDWND